MNDDDAAKSLDDLLVPGSTLMVAAESGPGALEFRPLTVARVNGPLVEILLDTSEQWARWLGDGDGAHVTMGDTRENKWLSFRARMDTTTDPELVDELWNPFADAYFEQGRETPGITVLRLHAEDGRYWTAPSGRLGSLISALKAKVGGAERSGEHGSIAV